MPCSIRISFTSGYCQCGASPWMRTCEVEVRRVKGHQGSWWPCWTRVATPIGVLPQPVPNPSPALPPSTCTHLPLTGLHTTSVGVSASSSVSENVGADGPTLATLAALAALVPFAPLPALARAAGLEEGEESGGRMGGATEECGHHWPGGWCRGPPCWRTGPIKGYTRPSRSV